MNPFFFGTSEKQLFGVHHAPEGTEVRDGAVLICPPFGHEYIAAHGSLQHLAGHLARAGLHALRFDHLGCGDSAGDIDDASIEQWLDDIATALEELRDTTGSKRVTILGLRLGATLGALAASRARAAGDRSIRAAVLWEPVVRGADYLEYSVELQERWLGAMYMRPPRKILHSAGPEIMGFVLPERLQEGLRTIDLSELTPAPAEQILVVQNEEGEHLAALRGLGDTVSFDHVPADAAWLGDHWQTIAVPPVPVLRHITEWVAGVYA